MKQFFSERNIVVVLFVMVLITFSLAQEDSKKIKKMHPGANGTTSSVVKEVQAQVVAQPKVDYLLQE